MNVFPRNALLRRAVADYRYRLLKLSRLKPHTLSAPEETLLASFGEVFAAPKLIAENLEDADLTFRSVKDKDGNEHEVTGSNYILLQSDPDRVLRKNAFESFYEGYKGHIHTFAAAYAGRPVGCPPAGLFLLGNHCSELRPRLRQSDSLSRHMSP
jgi:oligoendopeptidase F